MTTDRPVKITFAQMRESGVRGLLVYCQDHRCSHSLAISGDAWPDDARLSDIEARFVCTACGKRGPTCGRASFLERKPVEELILPLPETAQNPRGDNLQ